MEIKNKPNSNHFSPSKKELNLLGGYFDEEFDSEYVMLQLETEANRVTRAVEQINQHTPPKGTVGKFTHWLANLFRSS